MIDTAAERRELIAFRIGAQEFCVDIMAVREIRGWTPATPMPQSPEFVRGVINLRGAVLPIVDLSGRLGLGMTDPSARSVIIVCLVGGQMVGLLVDAVSDILTITDDQMQPAPELACEAVRAAVRGLIGVEGRMISLISLERLLPAAEAGAA